MSDIELTEEEKISLGKRKRMLTALKAVGGWISYLMGSIALIIAFFNGWGIEIVSLTIGLFITIIGLTLLHLHLKDKNFQGKPRVVKMVKYLGGICFIPGVVGLILLSRTPLNVFFYTFSITGFSLIIVSSILRKVWKLNKKLEFITTNA